MFSDIENFNTFFFYYGEYHYIVDLVFKPLIDNFKEALFSPYWVYFENDSEGMLKILPKPKTARDIVRQFLQHFANLCLQKGWRMNLKQVTILC